MDENIPTSKTESALGGSPLPESGGWVGALLMGLVVFPPAILSCEALLRGG